MLNQVIIVGRLTSNIEIKERENGGKIAKMTLAVPRSFKNAEGAYDTDFVKCILWDSIANNTAEYCNKGDVIGVKGRIQSEEDNMQIIAEKVTFLSSRKESEEK